MSGPGLARALRMAASDPASVTDLPGLLTAAAHRLDRDAHELAIAKGVPEATIRYQNDLGPQDDANDGPGGVSGDVRGKPRPDCPVSVVTNESEAGQ